MPTLQSYHQGSLHIRIMEGEWSRGLQKGGSSGTFRWQLTGSGQNQQLCTFEKQDCTYYILSVSSCDLLPFGESAEWVHQSKTVCHRRAFSSHLPVQPTRLTTAKTLLLSQPPPPPPPCTGPSGFSDDSDNPEPTYCKLDEKLYFLNSGFNPAC